MGLLFAIWLVDPNALLRQAQEKIVDYLQRMPKYLCTQTIDRVFTQPDHPMRQSGCEGEPSKRSSVVINRDRLRLDVALASKGEVYSWVGENKFADRDLTEIVGEGAITSGAFAALLTSVFGTRAASFTYVGEQSHAGRKLLEFSYRVPQEKSDYHFGGSLTGYEGTALIDSANASLVRLVARTNRLPETTGACYATTTLDYGAPVRLKSSDLLLAKESRFEVVYPNGSGSDNHSVFTGCREFIGESKITYDVPPDAAAGERPVVVPAGSPAAPSPRTFPAGLQVKVYLEQGIETAYAAVGDPVRMKLDAPLRDGAKVLAPAGAHIKGRIIQLLQSPGGAMHATVKLGIKLESVEVAGAILPISATPAFFQRRIEHGQKFEGVLWTLETR